MRFYPLLFIAALVALSPASICAAPIDGYAEQRKAFIAARKMLYSRQYTRFKKASEALRDYPLYPYLRYAWLRKRLARVPQAEIIEFLDTYAELPVSPLLRNAWLQRLARQGRWDDFLAHYRPTSNIKLQCQALRARLKRGDTEDIAADIQTLWLVGYSQPSACDPAFSWLYKSEHFGPDLVWQRIRLAMQKGHTSLAVYLARKLATKDQAWVKRWQKIHWNPVWHLRHTRYADTPIVREIYLHAIKRAARRKLSTAHELWLQIRQRHAFSRAEIHAVERDFALRAAREQHEKAWEWISELREARDDTDARSWRIRTALAAGHWPAVRQLIALLPPDERETPHWQYWYARALEQDGSPRKAAKVYADVAGQRDYHSFLAADKLGLDYAFNDRPTQWTEQQLAAVSSRAPLVRAAELFRAEMYADARREWREDIKDMSPRQLVLASVFASQIGWHDRAILTVAQAGEFDDLSLRFPLHFAKHIEKQSSRFKITPAWTYGVIRQESVFMHDARSSAGARGLMQIMPSTGRFIAKRLREKRHKTAQLNYPSKNIRFGAFYLRQMLDKFGNETLATAAYNAGPLRVDGWLPESGCVPADLWVEQIPFNETRRYVRRVLEYRIVYDRRLNRERQRISEFMPGVGSDGSKSGHCKGNPHIAPVGRGSERNTLDNGEAVSILIQDPGA